MSAPLKQTSFVLERTEFGKLILTNAQGERFAGVLPVRAFPILAPGEGISLLSTEGHEVAWVDRLGDLPAVYQSLIEDELARREFMPQLHRILEVSSFSTPCTWTVETDRGRVVEEGTHDALMQQEGPYFNLYQAQARNADAQLALSGGAV